MPARTGAEYLKGLKATSREIWLGEERVHDVAEHPQLKGGADAIAAYYDLQHSEPEKLLIEDDETGEPINISHMQPRSVEDLRRRAEGLTAISELSMGVMGRTPDYMNVTFAGFADDEASWAGPDGSNAEGYENLVAFQKRLRREDLSLTHTIVHPTINKETDDGFGPDTVRLHKVGETADSIIVRGARLLATLAPFADVQTVYPGHPLAEGAGPEFALSFSVPMDAPGMVFLCRDSGLRANVNPLDAPFSTRFDELDAYAIFDNVEIPKADVWIDGNIGVYNSVMMPTSWWPNIMQQTTIRALTKLEFAYGLGIRMAEAINDNSERTLELLGEIQSYIELTRNALEASLANAETYPGGGVYPEGRAMHPMRSVLPLWFARVNEIFKTIGSHNLLSTGSQAQLADSRVSALLAEYLPGANDISAEDRTYTYRLAWDFIGSMLGSRNELYERNYLASTKTNRIASHMFYSMNNRARGEQLFNDFRAATAARAAV